MISLDLGAGARFDDFAGVGVFLAAALTGKTPPERPLDVFDMIAMLWRVIDKESETPRVVQGCQRFLSLFL